MNPAAQPRSVGDDGVKPKVVSVGNSIDAPTLRFAPSILWLLFGVWLLVALTGFNLLAWFAETPGRDAAAPAPWPGARLHWGDRSGRRVPLTCFLERPEKFSRTAQPEYSLNPSVNE